MTTMIKLEIRAALDGVEKNSRVTRRRPSVNVVYEKSKNPDPREFIPGGLTKMETSSKIHHRKVIIVKKVVK
jgi:hypothetical protein